MSEAALDALLRRDRVIVGALAAHRNRAYGVAVPLASFGDDVGHGDARHANDAGHGHARVAYLELGRGRRALRHVGRDDDRHDDAGGGADDPHVLDHPSAPHSGRSPGGADSDLRPRLPRGLDDLQRCRGARPRRSPRRRAAVLLRHDEHERAAGRRAPRRWPACSSGRRSSAPASPPAAHRCPSS